VPRRRLGNVLIAAALLVLAARPSSGQAFIPAAGDGTISTSFQSVHTSHQLDVNGVEGFPETTDAQALIWQAEYGLTDKIALHGSLPYIFGQYQGGNPHTVGRDLQPSDLDDGTYHSTFQDFYFGVRYGVVQKPGLAIAPFVEAIVPSHRYETLAQSAVGRDERLLLVGTAVGGFLDNILPGLHYQTRVSYGVAQKVVNIRTNRTGIDSSVGYFVNPRLAVQFIETFQYFHNGVYFIFTPELQAATKPPGPFTSQHGIDHDRLLMSRVLNLGGGATFALNDSVGFFAAVTTMAWGRSLPAPVRSLSVGMNWSFHTGRSTSRHDSRSSRSSFSEHATSSGWPVKRR
jgi:hypothetical protein